MTQKPYFVFSVLIALTMCGFTACSLETVESEDNKCPEGFQFINGSCEPVNDDDSNANDDDSNVNDDDSNASDDTIPDDEPPEPDDDEEDLNTEVPDAEIMVTPKEGITTVQGLQQAAVTVVLGRAPSAAVTIPIQSSDSSVAEVAPESLVFTTENWNNPQHVTITGTHDPLENIQTPYEIIVGEAETTDEDYSILEEIRIKASHITVNHGESEPGVTIIEPESLTLDKTEAELLLKGKAVTIKAELDPNATDQVIIWDIKNITDNVEYQHLVNVSYDNNNHSITLKSNVVLNSPDCINKKLDYARELKLTAKHSSGKTAEAVIYLKPYLPLSMTYGDLKKVRDFNTPGYRNKKPSAGKYELGELGCQYYNEETTMVFIKDMNDKYVDPYIYSVNGSNYGTRASVLGAARFLVTQFPKDVPYASSGLSSSHYSVPMTVGRYTMVSYKAADDKADYKAKERIFGLNLIPKAYNSFSSFGTNSVIMGGENQSEIVPWGCQLKDKTGAEIGANGLRCSGFVNWAMRNGRFYLGDWGTVIMAKTVNCKDSNGNYQRNFRCKDYVNNTTEKSHHDSANPNNVYESVYGKLSQLKESDFVKVSSLTKTSDFKAGDLLWYGNYTCKTASDGSCNVGDKEVDNKKCKGGAGHVAMILGISRNEDQTIKYVYVAEAMGRNGNHIKPYSISDLKKSWKSSSKTNGTDDYKCTYKDTRLIKMDNVYNYHHTKSPNTVKEDLNTYKYTELWF